MAGYNSKVGMLLQVLSVSKLSDGGGDVASDVQTEGVWSSVLCFSGCFGIASEPCSWG